MSQKIRKVIFLDVDGVLVTWKSMGDQRSEVLAAKAETFKPREWRHLMFGRPQLDRLQQIVEATGAEIVLSSSWRTGDKADFDRLFDLSGYPLRLVDETKHLWNRESGHIVMAKPREEEIFEWVGRHKPVRFVIFDDDSMPGLGDSRDFFIRTSMEHGLTDEHVAKAIKILNGDDL